VTSAAVIYLPSGRGNKLGAKLRREEGVGLVELLIALLVLNIGIFATFAAFTSGALAIRRASRISTAAAIADKQVEALRNTQYSNIGNVAATNTTGADGQTYNYQVALLSTGSQQTTGTYQGSPSVKVVQVTVRWGAAGSGGQVLATSTSTYSRCNQSGLGTDTGQTPCQS
jgi:Tfp pilus assembly protein PilV